MWVSSFSRISSVAKLSSSALFSKIDAIKVPKFKLILWSAAKKESLFIFLKLLKQGVILFSPEILSSLFAGKSLTSVFLEWPPTAFEISCAT